MPVERAAGGSSLIDVLDRVLDKGIVIDAWVRVSLVGIDLITVEARIVVASIDTYLKYSEAVGQVGSVSKPVALEPARASETVLAENAALRRQLAASEGGGKRLRRQLAASEAGKKPTRALAGEDRPAWLGPRPWPPARRSRGAPPCRRKRVWAWPSSCSPATTSRSARGGRWSGWPNTRGRARAPAWPWTGSTRGCP